MIVMMHFGDGTSVELEMPTDDPEQAVKDARDYVSDNAWFEVEDDDSGEVLASQRF